MDWWEKNWNEADFDDPTGDETLVGRLACFIIDQVPKSRLPVMHDYTFAEWDEDLVYELMGRIFDFDVTLTPDFLDEIRAFAVHDQGIYSKSILNLLDEYSKATRPAALAV